MKIPEEIMVKLEKDAEIVGIPIIDINNAFEQTCDALMKSDINMDMVTFQEKCFDLAYLQLRAKLFSEIQELREIEDDTE